jgi:5,10-methenyltetrahydromethanopterin hydrogenase
MEDHGLVEGRGAEVVQDAQDQGAVVGAGPIIAWNPAGDKQPPLHGFR